MSGDITITSTTTVPELHAIVYNANLDTYAEVYAELINQYPEFQMLIEDATVYTSTVELQQSSFISFINDQISDLYAEIASNTIISEDDEDIPPIYGEP